MLKTIKTETKLRHFYAAPNFRDIFSDIHAVLFIFSCWSLFKTETHDLKVFYNLHHFHAAPTFRDIFSDIHAVLFIFSCWSLFETETNTRMNKFMKMTRCADLFLLVSWVNCESRTPVRLRF